MLLVQISNCPLTNLFGRIPFDEFVWKDGPSLACKSAIKRPPSEELSRPPFLSIIAFASLLYMITSPSARAARGPGKCPDPSGAVARTHARASSLSTTPEPHPPPFSSGSFGAAERARLHSNSDLSLPWHGMVMTRTRPSAGHTSESVCRRCRGQADRPGRRRPLLREGRSLMRA